ncbi:MAG: hypothetical protein AAFQ58_02420 [Pseudomonadota bacterium]
MLRVVDAMGCKVQPVVPSDPADAGAYVRAAFAYTLARVGNARSAVMFDALAQVAERARASHDWARSDELQDGSLLMSFEVEDSISLSRWWRRA